jgi:S-adenosylmethionine:tRNA ribosyltransferase-isomerase
MGDDGLVQISFEGSQTLDSLLQEKGTMPLPPYIRRVKEDDRAPIDRERYQTVFAKRVGAVACPTAGLHFTVRLMDDLLQAGVSLVPLTLHVGHGTFKPVRVHDIRNHHLGEEEYSVGQETADAINAAKRQGRRVIGVGTTVVRTLETLGGLECHLRPSQGTTDLLITPGFKFKVIDGMITNFHLPRSSLLFLVSAFSGLESTKKAYEWAVAKAYRFYSYGDAMLIL